MAPKRYATRWLPLVDVSALSVERLARNMTDVDTMTESERIYTEGEGQVHREPRVLVAEDDDEMRLLLSECLRRKGMRVIECPNGLHLVEHLTGLITRGERPEFDIIISDIRMPWISGLQVFKGLRSKRALPPVILITAFGDEETHQQARNIGVAAIYDKPFDIDVLLNKVEEILSKD